MHRTTTWSCLAAAVLSLSARAGTGDDGLGAVAAACPAAAAWIRTHRDPARSATSDDHAIAVPTLRRQLRQRAERDQYARNAWLAAGLVTDSAEAKAVHAIDASNTAWLKRIVQASGFPTPAQVGADGVANAWLLVQHADGDLAFQSSVLDALQPRIKDGSIRASDVAMLIDRVRINQGKPQRYGSQFTGNPADPSSFRPSPVEDEAHVDERRAQMGLMPLADYTCAVKASYARQPVKK